MLLGTAVALMAQCLMSGLAFEVRLLNRESVARLEGDTFTAHPVILGAVQDAEPLIRSLMSEVRETTLRSVRAQLMAESAVSSP